MTDIEVPLAPIFSICEGSAYHGTTPENAVSIVEEQYLRPSKAVNGKKYKPWYGNGVYLYEDGICSGEESARHYVLTSKGQEDCEVVEAHYKVEKLLDLTRRENFDYLINVVIPMIGDCAPEDAALIAPQRVISVWKEADPSIEAVRGASFEGEGMGLSEPDMGNLLIDIQLIMCLSSPDSIQRITFLD